jgi:hypothetical protein
MLVKPMEMSALPFRILGWCLMFYGVVECVNSIKIYKAKKEYEDTQRKLEQASVEDVIDTSKIEDAEVVETEPQ